MSHINLSTIETLHIIFFHLLWCLRRPFTLQNSSWIEEGQVAAKKFISEYISWIQERAIRFLSNTSLTFDEQTSTLYTPHYEQPTQAALCPSCSCQKEWRYNRAAGELKPLPVEKRFISKPSQEVACYRSRAIYIVPRGLTMCIPMTEESVARTDITY